MQAQGKLTWTVSLSETDHGKPRKHPIWEVRYRLSSGRQSDKSLGKAWTKRSRPPEGYVTYDDAVQAAQAYLDTLVTDVPDDRKTVGRATAEFLADCEARDLRGSTMHEYRRMSAIVGAQQFSPTQTWGQRAVADITGDHVKLLHEELQSRDLRPDTLNHYRRVVGGMLGKDVVVEAKWRWLKPQIESRGAFAFYSPEDLERLSMYAANHIDRAAFVLASEAGLRLSEVIGLPVGNVKFEVNGRAVNKLWITQAFTRNGGLAGPKSHEMRSVPMSANVQTILRPLCAGKPADALVLCRPDDFDRPLCGIALYRRFKTAVIAAGLPVLRFHDLRHTFGSLAIQRFSPVEVQEWMGHADLKTTMRYLHTKEDPEASDKLTSLFAPQAAVSSVTPLSRNLGGRPAKNPGRCPTCGEEKAPGQAYCVAHMREARRQSADRKAS